jgi:hypothetical protein
MSVIRQLLDLRKTGPELLIVTVGVLLALWAESVWQDRDDLLREAELLQDILAELRSNHLIAQEDIAQNKRAMNAATEWADIVLNANERRYDELPALFSTALLDSRYDPNSGVLQSAIATGDIALIKNTGIRFDLVNWSGRAEETAATATALGGALGDLVPVLLAINPTPDLKVNELSAIGTFSSFSAIRNRQLSQLAFELESLINVIEEYAKQ